MQILHLLIAFSSLNLNLIKLVKTEYEPPIISPSLKSRRFLETAHISLPLFSEIHSKFADFNPMFDKNSTIFDAKFVEFDNFLNSRQTVWHKAPFFVANPSLRKSEIPEEFCRAEKEFFKLGFRILQKYREFGLPFQVKCVTCHPVIGGLANHIVLYPERDFTQTITKLAIETRGDHVALDYCTRNDCEQNPRRADFHDYLAQNDLHAGKWTRWSGEHVADVADRSIIDGPDGELSIHSLLTEGFTTMCGLELNSEIVSSNVFVNSDVILPAEKKNNENATFNYDSYEELSLDANQSWARNEAMNLEMGVVWEPFRCCSACCCPPAVCGHELATSAECENVFSARSRTGQLVIRKIWKERTITQSAYSETLSRLLSVPPYTRTGIAVFSSLLATDELKRAMDEIKSSLIPQFLAGISNSSQQNYEFRSGMFVESESCKDHEQKTDCSKWAKCHGISMTEIQSEQSETDSDSCKQVHFVDVLVGIEPLKIRVTEHDNLRIRMDPEVHDMNRVKPVWKVNLRRPKKYQKSRPCLLQGIVQRNDELLMLDFTAFDSKIDLILENDEHKKVRVTFENSNKRQIAKEVHYTIVYWAIAIVAFFVLLVSAVIFMQREKTRRLEKRLIGEGNS